MRHTASGAPNTVRQTLHISRRADVGIPQHFDIAISSHRRITTSYTIDSSHRIASKHSNVSLHDMTRHLL